MTDKEFALERAPRPDESPVLRTGNATIMLTPPVSADYWSYRVRLNDRQAIVAFPKFGTIGIGFAKEEDWNTNLPYTCHTLEILSHIWHNVDSGKPEDGEGDYDLPEDDISILQVHAAISAIQQAIAHDHPDLKPPNSQDLFHQPRVVDPLHPTAGAPDRGAWRCAVPGCALANGPFHGHTEYDPDEWEQEVSAERQRQVAKGYDADHDREHGVVHVLTWAEDYLRRGREIEAGAMIRAAREIASVPT